MKKLTVVAIILFTLFAKSSFAQTNKNISIFNRLLVFNSENQLLVVKVKNSNIWLTPGFYQDDKVFIREGLKNTAAAFGLVISEPQLRGVFVLKRNEGKELSYRNIFVAHSSSKVSKKPEIVDKIKWISIGKKNQLTTFPHIDILVRKVTLFPETIWGGSLSSYRENGKPRAKILEEFYPLAEQKKKEK